MRHVIQAPPFMLPGSFPGLPPGPPTMPMAPRQGQGGPGTTTLPGPVPFVQGPPPQFQAPQAYNPGPAAYTQTTTPYGQAQGMWPGAGAGPVGQGQPTGINPADLYGLLQGLAAPATPPTGWGWTAGREESRQD